MTTKGLRHVEHCDNNINHSRSGVGDFDANRAEKVVSVAERLAQAAHEARAIDPDEELCFLMRPDLHVALIEAHIPIPLAVWYSDVLPVAIGPDDRKTSDIHIYRKSDLEAMHTE